MHKNPWSIAATCRFASGFGLEPIWVYASTIGTIHKPDPNNRGSFSSWIADALSIDVFRKVLQNERIHWQFIVHRLTCVQHEGLEGQHAARMQTREVRKEASDGEEKSKVRTTGPPEMEALSTVISYGVWAFTIGLVSVVVYQLLTGRINVGGLLREKGGDRGFSLGRLQLLVLTIVGAVNYFFAVIANSALGTLEPAEFREILNGLLLVLGGSNSLYLGGKLYSLFRDRLDTYLPRA